ncbi:MAG TPA: hypothetical protein VN026_12425 [Bacteroidia bacterium]|jgi:hypothetical protein|nr:hypothetical protein [Bacteroidia bacterium]
MKNIKNRSAYISEEEWKQTTKLSLNPEEEKALMSFKLASSQENTQKYLLLGVIINSFGINLDEFLEYYNTFWVDSRPS